MTRNTERPIYIRKEKHMSLIEYDLINGRVDKVEKAIRFLQDMAQLDPERGLYVAYSGGKDRCFYKDGALNIVSADERISIIERSENSVTVKANGYVHALELEGELIFDDNYFSMLDGEVRTVSFRAADGAKDTSYTIKAYTLK